MSQSEPPTPEAGANQLATAPGRTMLNQLGAARGLLESAASLAVAGGALYLLGLVNEQAFFRRFGILPLYLDTPASTYIYQGTPAVITLLLTGYLLVWFRAIGSVITTVAKRGPRAAMRAFVWPRPGKVTQRLDVLSFLAARFTFAVLLLSPWLMLGAANQFLSQPLDGLSLWLAVLLAIAVSRWTDLRGVLLRHVPGPNRRAVSIGLLAAASFGLALVSAQRTGEAESWELATGRASTIVAVDLEFLSGMADPLPDEALFAVLVTDSTYYLMRRECPTPERPAVFAVPRANVASATLQLVDPTPAPLPGAELPADLVPRGFCWEAGEIPATEQ